jgi:hypothetical protein
MAHCRLNRGLAMMLASAGLGAMRPKHFVLCWVDQELLFSIAER